MTRGRLIARVAASFGLDTTVGSEELLLLQEWVDEAVRDVLRRTHCYSAVGTFTIAAGVADGTFPDDVLAIDDRTIASSTTKVRLVSTDEMYEIRRANLTGSGDSVFYMAIAYPVVMIWPTPSANVTITYLYVPDPDPMSSDSIDTATLFSAAPPTPPDLGIPREGDMALEAYMEWRAARYDDKRSKPDKDYWADYLVYCQELKKSVRHKGQRGLLPSKVGYPWVPSRRYGRNDIYP